MASPTVLNVLQVDRQVCTAKILEAKRLKNVTWEQIAKACERSPVWVTSCCLGENSMDQQSAEKLATFLGITDSSVIKTLMTPSPLKGHVSADVLLQDPCIYRLHEATMVYGLALKEIIQEKFGDGIMSAIDFEMEVEKEERKEGDRVKIVMSGKYLPYKRW